MNFFDEIWASTDTLQTEKPAALNKKSYKIFYSFNSVKVIC